MTVNQVSRYNEKGSGRINAKPQTQVELTGSEVTVTLPTRTVGVVFQASVGNIDMGWQTGFTTEKYTIFQGQSVSVDLIEDDSKVYYFNGTGTLQYIVAEEETKI